MIGGQHHSPNSRCVPWEVSHPICVGAWQNNHNDLWKKGPNRAQQLNIHLGWDSHTLQQTQPSTWPSLSLLHATQQKTWNPFISAYMSKLTRGDSTLCKVAPFVLGTHFLPEVSQYSTGEASSLRQHRGRGAQAPTLCTLNGCQLIQWQHPLKPSSPFSCATEKHEGSFKSPTAWHKFGLVSNTWKPLVTKLSHLLLCVHGSRLFHHMLLFSQEKKAEQSQQIPNNPKQTSEKLNLSLV